MAWVELAVAALAATAELMSASDPLRTLAECLLPTHCGHRAGTEVLANESRRRMGKFSKESLLKHRKSLEIRELKSGNVRAARRSHLASAEIGGFPLDTTEQRIASVEKRIAQIDDQIMRGDHA